MASPGEIKTNNQELGLMLIRFVIFVFTVLLVGFSGLMLQLPGAIAGSLAGLVGFGIIVGTSMFTVIPFACPQCGHRTKVIKNTGSFQCPGCEQELFVYEGKVNKINS